MKIVHCALPDCPKEVFRHPVLVLVDPGRDVRMIWTFSKISGQRWPKIEMCGKGVAFRQQKQNFYRHTNKHFTSILPNFT